MYLVNQLKWDQVHYKWNDIKFDSTYQQYLLETYGITAIEGRVLWGYVIEVTVVPGPPPVLGGAGPTEDYPKQKQRKKIKLIFIMEGLRKEEVKNLKEKKAKVKYVGDIKNNIEEQLGTKIILKDVQIIKG